MTARALRRCAAALLALASAGCGEDLTVRLFLQSDPPLDPAVGRDRVVIAEGTAIGVLARTYEEDGDQGDEDDTIELVSADGRVVDARPGLEPNTFVLVARAAGRATIDTYVDGEVATPITIVVEAQPAP